MSQSTDASSAEEQIQENKFFILHKTSTKFKVIKVCQTTAQASVPAEPLENKMEKQEEKCQSYWIPFMVSDEELDQYLVNAEINFNKFLE